MNNSGGSLGIVLFALSLLIAVSCGKEEGNAPPDERLAEGLAATPAQRAESCASIAAEIGMIDSRIDAPAWAGLLDDLLASKEALRRKAAVHGCEATDPERSVLSARDRPTPGP